MPTRRRIYFALLAVLFSLCLSLAYRIYNPLATNDMFFPICGAQSVLHGADPYQACPIIWKDKTYPQNPMTTILAALPFALLGYVGGILLWSICVGLLVFGLLKEGQWWRLLTLLSSPFFVAFLTLQWAPLFLAILYLPSLLPLTLIKPQIGLPVALTRMTRRRVVLCAAFGLATLLVDPAWPLKWWAQARGTYDGYIPLLVLPIGPLLLFSLLRWRSKKDRFLALMAAVPQRGLYDPLLLWWLPETPGQMFLLTGSSWLAYLFVHVLKSPIPYPTFIVVFVYLPALTCTLLPIIRSQLQTNAQSAQPVS